MSGRADLAVDIVVDIDGFVVACSLAVAPGETVALVGPNGAGKSTVLRAIAGLQPIGSGIVALGDSVWDEPGRGVFVPVRERGVGVVFQDYALFGHLSVVDNVAFGLRATGISRRRADERARAMVDRLGIGHVADRRPGELSGGEAQRVAIARAIVGEPRLVLLDEPLAALDASTRSVVRRELPRWLDRERGTAAGRIIVTHDPVDADALADRVVVLEGGRVTQRGTVRELAASPRSPYVADLMGTNLLRGALAGHRFVVDDGGELTVGAHELADGEAVAAIRPAAVALHRARPEGSPRNVWATRIEAIDRSHDRVRVSLDGPLALVVEVTEAGLDALDIGVGDELWASVKASEIAVAAP